MASGAAPPAALRPALQHAVRALADATTAAAAYAAVRAVDAACVHAFQLDATAALVRVSETRGADDTERGALTAALLAAVSAPTLAALLRCEATPRHAVFGFASDAFSSDAARAALGACMTRHEASSRRWAARCGWDVRAREAQVAAWRASGGGGRHDDFGGGGGGGVPDAARAREVLPPTGTASPLQRRSGGGPSACAACERERAPDEAPFRKCGRCRTLFYCSTACQAAHWTAGHKRECTAA
jgi:hypothetical protein